MAEDTSKLGRTLKPETGSYVSQQEEGERGRRQALTSLQLLSGCGVHSQASSNSVVHLSLGDSGIC